MSSIRFELEGSSSGRRLYIELWYGTVRTCVSISHIVGGTKFKKIKVLANYESNQQDATVFFFVALRPNAGHGLLSLEVSRSHTTTQHSR